jgi:DnaK suppressor protein
MRPDERDQLKERILDQLVETKSRIADLEEITKPIAPDQALGRLTRLDGMLDKSVNEAALLRLREDRVRLQNAMVNIGKPEFGLCQNCHEPIPMARMEAMPQSTLCIGCA